jgi:hypothetical protein
VRNLLVGLEQLEEVSERVEGLDRLELALELEDSALVLVQEQEREEEDLEPLGQHLVWVVDSEVASE